MEALGMVAIVSAGIGAGVFLARLGVSAVISLIPTRED